MTTRRKKLRSPWSSRTAGREKDWERFSCGSCSPTRRPREFTGSGPTSWATIAACSTCSRGPPRSWSATLNARSPRSSWHPAPGPRPRRRDGLHWMAAEEPPLHDLDEGEIGPDHHDEKAEKERRERREAQPRGERREGKQDPPPDGGADAPGERGARAARPGAGGGADHEDHERLSGQGLAEPAR